MPTFKTDNKGQAIMLMRTPTFRTATILMADENTYSRTESTDTNVGIDKKVDEDTNINDRQQY